MRSNRERRLFVGMSASTRLSFVALARHCFRRRGSPKPVNAGRNLSQNRRLKPEPFSAPCLSFQELSLLAFETVAISSHDDDFSVVNQTVDESGNSDRIAEDLRPTGKGAS